MVVARSNGKIEVHSGTHATARKESITIDREYSSVGKAIPEASRRWKRGLESSRDKNIRALLAGKLPRMAGIALNQP